MAILKRAGKNRLEKQKPDIITGDFELHYEDVVSRNRYSLVALLTSGLILLAAFIPNLVHHSAATTEVISIEAESGTIINGDFISSIKNDITASNGSYLEFNISSPSESQ